ncbi:MAG: methylated-DNA--[protein]-cysteine S-methyltransferase [Fluviicola sp.]|nr:methylated-DNA--[protein]-cysteine S-methyltransferase [Fluviicola sp.]
MQLTAASLQRIVQAPPFSVSLVELSAELQLGVWEARHLFQEYVGCDPIRVLHNSWSPGLAQVNSPAQLSIFDTPTQQNPGKFLKTSCELEALAEDPSEISYSVHTSCLGDVFVASTADGICQLTFEDAENGLERLQKTYPGSELVNQSSELQELAVNGLKSNSPSICLPLKIKATAFQLSVWHYLLGIASGNVVTYSMIADFLGDAKASRAVGTAVGANPIALLIPCHRVVHRGGKIGNFRWGTDRKRLLLAIEKG